MWLYTCLSMPWQFLDYHQHLWLFGRARPTIQSYIPGCPSHRLFSVTYFGHSLYLKSASGECHWIWNMPPLYGKIHKVAHLANMVRLLLRYSMNVLFLCFGWRLQWRSSTLDGFESIGKGHGLWFTVFRKVSFSNLRCRGNWQKKNDSNTSSVYVGSLTAGCGVELQIS